MVDDVRAGAALATAILHPSSETIRAAVDALVETTDADREAALTALEATYGPQVSALRIPLAAAIRARNHRPGERTVVR